MRTHSPIVEQQSRATVAAARLIALEGLDGSGKTTLIHKLREALEASLAQRMTMLDSDPVSCLSFNAWDGADWTKVVRQVFVDGVGDPRTEMMLAFAARRALLQNKVKPAMADGSFVLLDRYVASSAAYQCTTRDDLRLVLDLQRDICGGVIPGLTLYLDVSHETALARAGNRDQLDSIESRGELFHEHLDVAYRIMFAVTAAHSNGYAVRIDANQDEATVFGEALAVCETYLDLLFGLNVNDCKAKEQLDAWNITGLEDHIPNE